MVWQRNIDEVLNADPRGATTCSPADDVAQAPKSMTNHMIVRKQDGGLVAIPLGSRGLVASALKLYAPSRWAGKSYRTALRMALPIAGRLGLAQRIDPAAGWYRDLTRIVGRVAGAAPQWTAALTGAGRRRTRTTLKFMDRSGSAIAYGKAGNDTYSAAMVRNEFSLLSALSKGPLSRQIPSLITAEMGQADVPFLVETAGPEDGISGSELTAKHFAFLAGLAGTNHRPWAHIHDRLAEDTGALRRQPGTSALVNAAIGRLREQYSGAICVAIEHGDFAPWNILANALGDLFVVDWEHGRTDGLPWLDALHFVFQFETLVRHRSNPADILARLRAVFDRPEASDYRERTAPSHMATGALVIIYLLHAIARYVDERGTDADCGPAHRVLQHALDHS